MICAACHSSDAALDVTFELVNLVLSGELPREAFLLDGLLIGAPCAPRRARRCVRCKRRTALARPRFMAGQTCHDQVPGHACMCGCGALVALV